MITAQNIGNLDEMFDVASDVEFFFLRSSSNSKPVIFLSLAWSLLCVVNSFDTNIEIFSVKYI